MAKILLVEDDTNLSEIYQARLQAEGYQIVSAHDGEEALALAAKEKPDLVISDVMMPKISGFEMLDILRNTPDLKNAKVIMLTALGQAEDKTRAEGLGADRYLVKSQVTLEDIVKAAQELLTASAPPATTPVSSPTPAGATTPVATAAPAPAPVSTPVVQETVTNAAPTAQAPITPAQAPAPVATPTTTTPSQPQATPTIPVATPPATAPAPAAISMPTQTPAATAPAATQPASTLAEPMSGSTSSATASPVISAADALASAQKAFEPSSFAPPAPAQASAPIETPADANAAADDKVVSDAVQDLLGDTKTATTPADANSTITTPAAVPVTPAGEVPTTPAATPAPTDTQTPQAAPETAEPAATLSTPEATPTPRAQPAAETPAAASTDDANSNVSIAHKKIIRPIDNPNPRPDLDSLLAAEEQRNPGTMNAAQAPVDNSAPSAPQPPVMHQPGNVFKPTSSGVPNQSQNGVDPNSIAL